MGALRWAGPALLLLGVLLVAAAVANGAAHLAVFVIVPVVFGGASALFLGGVAALFGGIALLPLAFLSSDSDDAAPSDDGPPGVRGSAGGLVLLGPVPIFLGSWKHPGRRVFWIAVAFGVAVLLAAAIVLTVGV